MGPCRYHLAFEQADLRGRSQDANLPIMTAMIPSYLAQQPHVCPKLVGL